MMITGDKIIPLKIKRAMESLDLLTVEEVAKMLRVKPLTIYRRLAEGKIEAWKIDGLWRIPRKNVMSYLVHATITNAPKKHAKVILDKDGRTKII